MPAETALVSHPDCALHDTGWNHPEHQGRLPAIVKGLYSRTPELIDRWLQAEAPRASEADVLRVHTPAHVEVIRTAAAAAAELGHPQDLTSDTRVSGASWDAALGAAGAAIHATGLVLDGAARTAFALTRPPGHHATPDQAMGFCLFNHVAVAARWAQAERGIGRVLIVDWDVHHGNGTQDIFYEDGSVCFVSFHLSPHYPGTGPAEERGAGEGEGATVNVPLPHGFGRAEYLAVFEETVREVASSFRPELVLVSAGFDCLAGDPLGGLLLEPADLFTMTRVLMEVADGGAEGRLVHLLEGGYVPKRAADGAVEVVRALAGLTPSD
jgi:acetoin utilization deacetylase AcuC-like enzyme